MRHSLNLYTTIGFGSVMEVNSLALGGAVYQQTASTEAELQALRDQFDLLVSVQGQLLNTVYWTLGAVGTVVILLIGFNWFQQWRLTERERRDLREAMLQHTDQRVATLEKNLTQEATRLRENLFAELREGVERSTKAALSDLNRSIGSTRRSVNRLTLQQKEAEARYWQAEGVRANESLTYHEMLAIASQWEDDFYINTALNKLIGLYKQGHRISETWVPDLMETLERLPPKYGAQIQQLRTLMKSV